MRFLSSTIPNDGAVVVPPDSDQFSAQSTLQFFLLPRSIPSCICDENPNEYSTFCIECLRKDSNYVPAIGGFPAPEVMNGWKTLIPFTPKSSIFHGIYAPLQPEPTQPDTPIKEPTPLFIALVIDVLICLLIFLLGYFISTEIIQVRESFRALVAAIPVGMGSLTWAVFLVSWVGIPVSLITFLIVYLGLLSAVVAVRIRTLPDEEKFIPSISIKPLIQNLSNKRLSFKGILFLIVIMFGLALFISVGRGYSLYDGIANWALKGYAIAYEGSIYAGQKWGGHSLSYPQNIHLMISLFKLADGDVLPGSKIMFPLFAVSLLYGCYKALRRWNVDDVVALLTVVTVFTVPVIFTHSTFGWGNFIFTSYIVLGTLYWIEGISNQRFEILILGGILLAFSTWTRPEGIAFAAAITLGTWLTNRIKGKKIVLPRRLLMTILIPVTFITFSYSSVRQDEIGQVLNAFWENITRGIFNLQHLSLLSNFTFNRFIDTYVWGYIPHIIVLLFAFILVGRRLTSESEATLLIVSSTIALLFPLFMFYAASFSKTKFTGFLYVSFDRAMMPFIVLIYFSFAKLTLGSKFQQTANSKSIRARQ